MTDREHNAPAFDRIENLARFADALFPGVRLGIQGDDAPPRTLGEMIRHARGQALAQVESQASLDRQAFERAAAGQDYSLRTDGADYYDHRASAAYAMFLAGCAHARAQQAQPDGQA